MSDAENNHLLVVLIDSVEDTICAASSSPDPLEVVSQGRPGSPRVVQ